MTFTDAAVEVLRLEGRPLHYKTITDIAIEKNLLSHVGKSPEVTMGARLAATLKKDSPENPLVRVKPGVFALREWDEKTIKAGLDGKKAAKKHSVRPEGARAEGEAVEAAEPEELDAEPEAEELGAEPAAAEEGDEAAEADDAEPGAPKAARAAAAPAFDDEEEDGPSGPEETMRAEAAVGASDLFDEEDDDDQPILGGDERPAQGAGGAAAGEGEGRRRRRRRRRGRGGNEVGAPAGANGAPAPQNGGLPSYTATPVFESRREGGQRDRDRDRDRDGSREVAREGAEAAYRGPQVIDLAGGEGPALDDLAGKDLADAVAVILTTFDRNGGPVSLRQIAETAQRRGRLSGDAQLVQSQVAAAVRADNARRIASGQRPRFRFAGGRVALTDWVLSSDLARLEAEAVAAVERYREAARRAFARKLGELPGHAFVELVVFALEKLGVQQIRAIRRAGAPGGETHFSGELKTGGDAIKLAIVIRRDGREIGRERVTELRGSLHHYGPATLGWIFTAGQTLSGAREEAAVPGTAPVALYDGAAIARLCEENDVAVIRAKMPIAIPDVDLLEALRAS
jgi:hypothetical protein